jgi:transketolase
VLNLEPFGAKWQSFGWGVREINGHDLGEIREALISVPFERDRPSCIIAHTVKGKGVSFMEDKLLWHYRAPNDEEFEEALLELEGSK